MIDVAVKGDEATALLFDELGRRVSRPRDGIRRIFDVLRAGERAAFATGGAAIGEAWPGLKKSTLRRRAREGHGDRPLIATGRLFASLTAEHDLEQIATVRGATGRFGSRRPSRYGEGVPVVRFLAAGGRDPVGTTPRIRRQAADEMLAYLMRGPA